MKVHLIKESTIRNFVKDHALSKAAFEDWLYKIKNVQWQNPQNLKQHFAGVDILGNGSKRIIFDIGGNNYRLIIEYCKGEKEVHFYVCWIGTHHQYDKICNKSEQYTINIY